MLDGFPARLQPGDKAPACYGMAPDRTFYASEQQYGRPCILILLGSALAAGVPPIVQDLLAHLGAFTTRNADVCIMVDDNPAGVCGGSLAALPIRTIDAGGFLVRCGVGAHDTLVLLLDRNLRVALRGEPAPDIAQRCLAALDALPRETARDISTPAPVIVLANLLAPALCRDLIALFESSPTTDGAVARVDAAGTVCNVVDHSRKFRRDLMLDADSVWHATLRDLLLDRCAPEIAKAFQCRVTHTDRILIARYDDTGGWFYRHRDNVASNVTFREFALSINLNTGAFEGGHVIFPEYNDHRYRAPAGAGVIFSTAVLHEATPVTKGHRYVLLTFLHGEAAEARRLSQASAET